MTDKIGRTEIPVQFNKYKLTDAEKKFLMCFWGDRDKAYAYEADLIQDMRSAVEEMVNSFSFRAEPIVFAAKDCGELIFRRLCALSVAYVEYWAEAPDTAFDGRNERAGTLIREVDKSDWFRHAWSDYTDALTSVEWAFAEASRRMHKTLMQSFTQVMLFVLASADAPWAEESRLHFSGDENWWRLPLI